MGSIDRNCQEELHCQFANQLLFMTLGFVTRMIKNEVIREELKVEGKFSSFGTCNSSCTLYI